MYIFVVEFPYISTIVVVILRYEIVYTFSILYPWIDVFLVCKISPSRQNNEII